MNDRHRGHVRNLALIFLAVMILSGFSPSHRSDWFLENALVVVAVPILVLIYRRLPFSRLSWTLVFLFLCLHELGAHFTYSEVPYLSWWRQLTGSELAAGSRNHFDRFVHLCYGLLLAYPVREIFLSLARVRGFWSYFLPLDLVMSTSALYEIIEWGAAEVFSENVSHAYVGAQGDVWDAQKDMILAAAGALATMTATAIVNWRCQRDFAREWAQSLSVRKPSVQASADRE